MFLVANKCDIKTEGGISREEAMKLAEDKNAEFYEVSAKEGINIEKMLETMVGKAIETKYIPFLSKNKKEAPKTKSIESDVYNDNVLMEKEDYENEKNFQKASDKKGYGLGCYHQ